MTPIWSNIANNVKSIQVILEATLMAARQMTASQNHRAAAGMRQNSVATKIGGGI